MYTPRGTNSLDSWEYASKKTYKTFIVIKIVILLLLVNEFFSTQSVSKAGEAMLSKK